MKRNLIHSSNVSQHEKNLSLFNASPGTETKGKASIDCRKEPQEELREQKRHLRGGKSGRGAPA